MDRDANVRAARRREAEAALAFERDREAVLLEEVDEVAAQLDGRRFDAEVYATLAPEDVELVRAALGQLDAEPDEEDEELEPADDADGLADEPVAAEPGDAGEDDAWEPLDERADAEAEIARLESEIAACRRSQAALERYLAAIEPPAGAAG